MSTNIATGPMTPEEEMSAKRWHGTDEADQPWAGGPLHSLGQVVPGGPWPAEGPAGIAWATLRAVMDYVMAGGDLNTAQIAKAEPSAVITDAYGKQVTGPLVGVSGTYRGGAR